MHQTHGPKGRLQLPSLFEAWEAEALEMVANVERGNHRWEQLRAQRALGQKSPFSQGLLGVCHRDVVLVAQQQARQQAQLPESCRRPRLPGERALSRAQVDALRSEELVVIDGLLPADVIARCCEEVAPSLRTSHQNLPSHHPP